MIEPRAPRDEAPAPRPSLVRRFGPALAITTMVAWGLWSYATGGLMFVLVQAASHGEDAVAQLRTLVLSAGAFAPLVYVAAVTIEVVLAPIPGTLLYAPGGAIFGGWWGGTLSLAGNVSGAALATWLASMFGTRVLAARDWPRLAEIGERVRRRGILVVLLLRINPLTSSDLVSYAAGLAGVPVWRVAVGTAVGMAPLCYAQAFAAEWIFRVLPGAGVILLVSAIAYVLVVGLLLIKGRL
jgi:uncharacterized membrane protein YdjX (TVP38/TMEM64 family)